MTRNSRLLAAALAALMVTSVFGSIGAMASTGPNGVERIGANPSAGDAGPTTEGTETGLSAP